MDSKSEFFQEVKIKVLDSFPSYIGKARPDIAEGEWGCRRGYRSFEPLIDSRLTEHGAVTVVDRRTTCRDRPCESVIIP